MLPRDTENGPAIYGTPSPGASFHLRPGPFSIVGGCGEAEISALIVGQLTEVSLREPREGEAPEGAAVEGFDMVTDRCKHPAHLVIAALVEGQATMSGRVDLELRRTERGSLTLEHEGARGEYIPLITAEWSRQGHDVYFRYLCPGRG